MLMEVRVSREWLAFGDKKTEQSNLKGAVWPLRMGHGFVVSSAIDAA